MLLTIILPPWLVAVSLVWVLCRAASRDDAYVRDDGDRATR
jgi:hypothetical protein